MIACKTIIGFGAPNKQGGHDVHGAPLGVEEIAATRKMLDWPHDPFTLPDDVTAAWATIAARGAQTRATWAARLDASPNRAAFLAAQGAPDAPALRKAIADYCQRLVADRPKVATRKASEMALEVINATLPQTIGGSADLTGSNLTRSTGMQAVGPGDYAGRYVHYGIREHGMAAVMNGIALHGGFMPYGGTFLAFADYSRPAIRLGALMGVPVIHVMTHDSIGLGEDGPTHQPVEHLASLRALPNLQVFRPADAVETAEAWEIALTSQSTPSVLALSRQNLPTVRIETALIARACCATRPASGSRPRSARDGTCSCARKTVSSA
jgi:transketolase